MTIKELKSLLEKYPEEMLVVCNARNDGFRGQSASINYGAIRTMAKHPDYSVWTQVGNQGGGWSGTKPEDVKKVLELS